MATLDMMHLTLGRMARAPSAKDDRISVRWKYCTRFRVENPTQRAILTVIGENCDLVIAATHYISKLTVAKRIGASRTSVYRAVKRLEALGGHWSLRMPAVRPIGCSPSWPRSGLLPGISGRKIRPRNRRSNSRGNSGRLSRKTCRHQFNLKHHWFNLNSHWFNLKQ